MKTATVIINLDLSQDDKPDAFWEGYFRALVARMSCPASVETTVAYAVETEADEPVFPLLKRKGMDTPWIPYDEWIAYSGGGWTKVEGTL